VLFLDAVGEASGLHDSGSHKRLGRLEISASLSRQLSRLWILLGPHGPKTASTAVIRHHIPAGTAIDLPILLHTISGGEFEKTPMPKN
jgi:hypothetical protein